MSKKRKKGNHFNGCLLRDKRQDCIYPSLMPFDTASNAEDTPNFSNICCTWLETVLSLM
jgi:hypothetical protein